MPPLHAATDRDDAAAVRELLKRGADIDGRDNMSQTPLMRAAEFRRNSVVKVLIESGADLSITDYVSGRNALQQAADFCNLRATSLLLQAGADPEYRDGLGRVAGDMLGLNFCSMQQRGKLNSDFTQTKVDAIYFLLKRAPAFPACSWLWPVDAIPYDYSCLSSEDTNKLGVRLLRDRRRNVKTWRPISAILRYAIFGVKSCTLQLWLCNRTVEPGGGAGKCLRGALWQYINLSLGRQKEKMVKAHI